MNTFVDALIAALILFLSSMVTLFASDPLLEFNTIPTSVWVSMLGGAGIAFFKGFQTLTTRRAINRVTKTGDGGI